MGLWWKPLFSRTYHFYEQGHGYSACGLRYRSRVREGQESDVVTDEEPEVGAACKGCVSNIEKEERARLGIGRVRARRTRAEVRAERAERVKTVTSATNGIGGGKLVHMSQNYGEGIVGGLIRESLLGPVLVDPDERTPTPTPTPNPPVTLSSKRVSSLLKNKERARLRRARVDEESPFYSARAAKAASLRAAEKRARQNEGGGGGSGSGDGSVAEEPFEYRRKADTIPITPLSLTGPCETPGCPTQHTQYRDPVTGARQCLRCQAGESGVEVKERRHPRDEREGRVGRVGRVGRNPGGDKA